ncbi:spindle and kinetochore-associated protein 3-like [Patiria miniata]|uniref:Spindle and kinetochore-associated protein 3 n=1 Tax=Patiria miniata TaxID=46514 RepID=A0A914BRD8_PATMI|nr:spindle and kinetochore-associated protein 3-like [Patiria miniata]
MEKENFFTKLRRVATSTEGETARLKACMEKPAAVRSASSQDGSARLVLKEMQYDAQKMKEKVHQQLKELHVSSESFEETLDACEGLCEITKQQVTDLEMYLEQYGYKPYNSVEKLQSQQDKKKKQSKENVTPEPSPETTKDCHSTEEKIPSTPPKDPSSAPPVDPNKTPQLADFGLSQWTIDRLAHVGLNGNPQDMKTVNFTGYQYGSIPSAIPSYMYPSTPQQYQKHLQLTPFTNRTILVTPGMFGSRSIPTETPQQFIDTKSYLLDSPVPPVLLSTKKVKPMTSDLRVTSRRDADMASPEPEPPTVTAWAEYVPLPAPPTQLHAPPDSADVTPPMPPCLATQATQVPMPAEPARLTERFNSAPTLPCEPVQLYQQFSANEMPTEPVQLAEKFGSENNIQPEPQFLQVSGAGNGQPSQTTTPKGHQRLAALAGEPEMPQTPELTMTYQRFVDIKPVSVEPAPQLPADSIPEPHVYDSHGDVPRTPVLQSAFNETQATKPSQATKPNQTSAVNCVDCSIAPVTDAEFGQVADYLQRLFPIDVINQKLADINAMLSQKQDGSFLSEKDMQALSLGSKTKAFALLLAKLRRLTMGKKPGSGEPVFYVIK